jgi:SAM-dependent methyltransferase
MGTKKVKSLRILIIIAIIALFPLILMSQIPVSQNKLIPEKGAKGKDVIWLPSPDSLIIAMLEMAKVGPGDVFFDLGSGDGRAVIEAAKLGALATGVEYELELVELSRVRAAEQGVSENTAFIQADLFEFDFSKATVIYLFLLPDLNLRLRPRLLALNPGTRIISNSFDMGEWEPDDQILIEYIEKENTGISSTSQLKKVRAFYWIVPGKAEVK